jgi:splicing factor 3A subunit 1
LCKPGFSPFAARPEVPKKADKWVVSPLTGERIPADKLQEHMRFNTVDTQYMEQRGR